LLHTCDLNSTPLNSPTHPTCANIQSNRAPGEFDAAFLLGELPKVLGIEDKRVRMLLKELVGARK
jgi:hypothetical protein